MPGSVWSGSAPAAGRTSRATAVAGTPTAITGTTFTAAISVGVSMDGLRQLAFLAAIGARGNPSCTRTVRPVDPISLDALCLELCVAHIAIEETHGYSSVSYTHL